MAQKTIKKTKNTVKKSTTKKSVVKSAPVKSATKKTTRVVARPVEPVAECKCGQGCHCCCCRGYRFIGLCIKVVILCIVFLLGCLSAPWFMRNVDKGVMHNIKFDDNNCVVLESIKCPKLLETLATADDNADGCISRIELKKAMHEMHKGMRGESTSNAEETQVSDAE